MMRWTAPSGIYVAGRTTWPAWRQLMFHRAPLLTKPSMALGMIERVISADVAFCWIAADSVYGVGDIEMALRRAGKGYVLGVNATHYFGSWVGKPEPTGTAEDIAKDLGPAAWRRLSAGLWTKRE